MKLPASDRSLNRLFQWLHIRNDAPVAPKIQLAGTQSPRGTTKGATNLKVEAAMLLDDAEEPLLSPRGALINKPPRRPMGQRPPKPLVGP